MPLNKRNPIWPYLLVLGCLFALSIAAPRGWQRMEHDKGSSNAQNFSDARNLGVASGLETQPSVVRPTTDEDLANPMHLGQTDVELTATKPQSEDAAEKVADQWRFGAGAELTVKPESPLTLGRSPAEPDTHWTTGNDLPPSDPTTGPAMPGAEDRHGGELQGLRGERVPDGDGVQNAALTPSARHEEATLANTIADQIKENGDAGNSEEPSSMPTLALPVGTNSVLTPPTDSGEKPVATTPQIEMPAPKIGEATEGDLPETTVPSTNPGATTEAAPPIETSPQPIASVPFTPSVWPTAEELLARLKLLAEQETCRGWVGQVRVQLDLLDKLSRKQCDRAQEVLTQLRQLMGEAEPLAAKFLDHASATELRRAQYALVRRVDIWEAVASVRRFTTPIANGLDTVDLLNVIERYESTHLPTDAQRLASLRNELQDSVAEYDRELARRIGILYRNANFRVAVSADLLNRMLPPQQPAADKVEEVILGSRVRGNSTTSTSLSVQMVPSPRQWQINLVASGNVDSQTYTTHGPVTLMNHSDANYRVLKQIVVDPSGMRIAPAAAGVNNSSELSGLRTHYDSVPLLRAIVRNYAVSQFDQQCERANREAEQTIATKAAKRVNEQTDPQLASAEQDLRRKFIEPLEKLGLDPAALTMTTTDKRLILRSRLAGKDQLGANTARPEAPSDSLASAQLHESAINNLLEHLDLGGRTFTLPELYKWLADKFGRGDTHVPDDLPQDVQITFAQYNPLVVRCDADRVEVTLNVAEIRQGKRHWRDFEVKALYRPTTRGLSAQLEREGAIELGGTYKGKSEFALRGIFSKVLSREHKLNVMPAAIGQDPRMNGLAVTQCVIEDGWIAVAIGLPSATTRAAEPKVRR